MEYKMFEIKQTIISRMIDSNDWESSEIELEIRGEFSELRKYSEEEFNKKCDTYARIGNETDMSWTSKMNHVPCKVVGRIQFVEPLPTSTIYYIVFWKDGRLLLGKNVHKVDDMNERWKEKLGNYGTSYYCTNAQIF
jgi:hypothetical protein